MNKNSKLPSTTDTAKEESRGRKIPLFWFKDTVFTRAYQHKLDLKCRIMASLSLYIYIMKMFHSEIGGGGESLQLLDLIKVSSFTALIYFTENHEICDSQWNYIYAGT